MPISFKQFLRSTDSGVEEGLSDMPGFGWLRGTNSTVKIAKIDQQRALLKNRHDAKSKELDAQFAAAKAAIESGKGPLKNKPNNNNGESWDDSYNARAAAFRRGMKTQ